MGMFAGIDEVKVNKRTRYVAPGNYRGKIEEIKYGRTKQEEKPYFVVEISVTESDNDDFPVGSTMTWMTMVHKFKHYFLEEVKGFVSAVTKSAPNDVTEDVVEYVAGEDQPLAGTPIGLSAWAEVNSKTDKTYTRTEFISVN